MKSPRRHRGRTETTRATTTTQTIKDADEKPLARYVECPMCTTLVRREQMRQPWEPDPDLERLWRLYSRMKEVLEDFKREANIDD